MSMDSRTAGRYAGPLSVLLALGGTLLATVVSPTFAWSRNALSELGAATTAVGTDTTVLLFNGGLLAGGLVALAFAWYRFDVATSTLERGTAVLFAMTAIGMGSVGVFPLTEPVHGPVAVAFFLGLTATITASATAAYARGDRGDALVDGSLATLHVIGWVAWLSAGGPESVGIAVPELWGSILLSAWVLREAQRPPGNRS